jgi:hypothetical protein
MDMTGSVCVWHNDASRDNPIPLEVVAAALKAAKEKQR